MVQTVSPEIGARLCVLGWTGCKGVIKEAYGPSLEVRVTRLTGNNAKIDPPNRVFSFLGTFAKLRKATISFVMSVRPHEQFDPLDGFS